MKNLVVFLAILLAIGDIGYAQISGIIFNKRPNILLEKVEKNRISPNTKAILLDLEHLGYFNTQVELEDSFLEKYLIRNRQGVLFVGGLIKVSEEYSENELVKIGAEVGTKSQDIWSVQIPLKNLNEVVNFKGIKYLQLDEKLTIKLDQARVKTKVYKLHRGDDLSRSYMGKDVVVGILDRGFDYTHPQFLDTSQTDMRIRKVWDQNATGTPPSGFNYGKEISGYTAILNAKYDKLDETHGTHVAGIAAGGGVGTSGKYIGVAAESDIILVSYSGGGSVLLDGIHYIFDYAASQGKPAVINMSLGTHIGPHDGTSLFDQACDKLVGQGKILVGAAGNEGAINLHLEHTFTITDTIFYSFIQPSPGINTKGQATIDIWGQQGKDFCMEVFLFDYSKGQVTATTYLWCANEDTIVNFNLVGSDFKTCSVSVITVSSEFNNKPRIVIVLDNNSDDIPALLGYGLSGISGKIHMWNKGVGNGQPFVGDNIYGFIDGDRTHTVGEIGGTGTELISVGAYTSKNTWIDYYGNTQSKTDVVDKLAPFSSRGPTVDGRKKPDITAPGNVVVSSVSRFDRNYPNTNPRVVAGVTNGTDSWYFAAMEGTSMAAPMAAGIIALWLEADPTLTPSDIRQLLINYSIVDVSTGSVPNNLWGWGKIHAFKVMEQLDDNTIGMGSIKETYFRIYPNPSRGVIRIKSKSKIDIIEVYDYSGKKVFVVESISDGPEKIIDLSSFNDGIYLIRCIDGISNSTQRVVLKR